MSSREMSSRDAKYVECQRTAAAHLDQATDYIPTSHGGEEYTRLNDLEFSRRLAEAGIPYLLTQDVDADVVTAYVIRLTILEKMNIHQLQDQLVNVVNRIVSDRDAIPEVMATARNLLADYSMYIPWELLSS
jgi:hypothetical protein